jgi:hypothetical protein
LLMRALYIPDMSEKKPFVLRIAPEKLKALEKWAADEFRSTNGQIEYILDHALRKSGRWKSKSDDIKKEEL